MLRIGGDTTDSTWWPVRGTLPPAGVSYGLTARWLITTRALAQDLGARLVLGVNLASDRPLLAAAEARAMLRGIGRSRVSALEIGNEPDIGNVPWMSALRRSLTAEPGLGLVTFHRYPLSCFARPGSPKYPTIANLLSNHASTGLADSVARFVAIAHSRGLPFRVDEINSVACGGTRGVSNAFASALWVLDTLFAMARVGVDGVNVHTLSGARYQPFAFTHTGGRWRAHVYPEYYGLLMFAQAAPIGSRLLPLTGSGGAEVKVWATVAPNRTIHVVLINKGPATARITLLRPARSTRWAAMERLVAPSLKATHGVALGGQTFGPATQTGSLRTQKTTRVDGSSGRYELALPPASATLLTL